MPPAAAIACAPQPAGTVTVMEGAAALEQASAAWEVLEAEGGARTPFQSLSVARAAAAAHLRQGDRLRIVLIAAHGRPLVLFPTVITRICGLPLLRFLGDPLIQYGDLLARQDATMAHLQLAWRAAGADGAAALALLRKVRADAAIAPLLAAQARPIETQIAAAIELRRPHGPNGHAARELRRLRRRLAEAGEVRFEVRHGHAAKAAASTALALKQSWLAERGLASAVVGNPHWERALLELTDHAGGGTELAVAVLTVADRLAAAEIAFVRGPQWCAYLGAVDPRFAAAGPGHVQMDATIAHCRARDFSCYDLLSPMQPYKRTLANATMPVTDYVAPLGPAGRIAVAAACLVPALRSLLAIRSIGWRALAGQLRLRRNATRSVA
jgi:CelD/BcsL family acetyltransferase involved in cellulose biosynthesis